LLLVDHSSTQQTVAGGDGRGNVTVLLDALATDTTTPMNNVKAGVEYAPYGEMVRSVGDLGQMPFRFQSKWAMGQGWTGSWPLELVDFGRRMYAPGLGRFISRDPAGESAGANLYHYCGNDPINRIDPLGLDPLPPPPRVAVDPWRDFRSFDSHPSLWGFYPSRWGNVEWGSQLYYDPSSGEVVVSSRGDGSSGGGASSGTLSRGDYEWVQPPSTGIDPGGMWWNEATRCWEMDKIAVTGYRGFWLWVPDAYRSSFVVIRGINRSGRSGESPRESAAERPANGSSWILTPRSFGGFAADQVINVFAGTGELLSRVLGFGFELLGVPAGPLFEQADACLSQMSPFGRAGYYDPQNPVNQIASVVVMVLLSRKPTPTAPSVSQPVVTVVRVGDYTLTDTVAAHLGERVGGIGGYSGNLSRPYLESPLTINEIIATGRGVPDPGGLPGALRYDVPGAFRGSEGTWELVVDPNSHIVYHLNFTTGH
jgi:RHS repeat-associated protein